MATNGVLWALSLFLIYIVMAELWVWRSAASIGEPTEIDYILVLGANGNEQSPVTMDRAVSAAQAAKLFPTAKIVLTGKSEEVEAYKSLLAPLGLSNFIEEKQSRTTWDNMRFSEKLMEPGKNILLVTSEYHQPRALAIARSRGWNAWAFGKDARIYEMRIYFFVKERFSNCKYFLPMLFANLQKP